MKLSGVCLLAALGSVEAFVKPVRRHTGSPSQLFFKKSIISALPPPPPPPPTQVSNNWGDFDLQNMVQSFLDGIHLPSVSADLGDLPRTVLATLRELQPETLSLLKSVVADLQSTVDQFDKHAMDAFEKVSQSLSSTVLADQPQLKEVVKYLMGVVSGDTVSPTLALIASSVVTYIVTKSLLDFGKLPPPSRPYPNLKYDPISARRYFDGRLPQVIARGLEITLNSLVFGVKVLSDKVSNRDNDEQRGRELAKLLTKLGPTFIKIGQSLSIRRDLLSSGYIRGLETLQDQVPPFDNARAIEILENQWELPLSDVIEGSLGSTVAAASLGQVYKAKLKSTGQQVAIKVQRPDIMEQVALDMHLLREFGGFVKTVFNLITDTVGTVDVWGAGFVDELDYLAEASNAELFQKQISETTLRDVVFAPKTVSDYTTRNVLVTEWVDGERLDKSNSADVTALCSIAMNTYLTMLLELGILHCDPHPGNLLRTPDGRLCILDFGMVTSLDKDLQLAMIEHVAHLTSADYKEVPRDLLLLGFVSPEKADTINDSGVVEVLADIYGAWSSGGGAAAIDVNQVVTQMQDLTSKKGNIFQLPPYFVYIAKSFSVLEGIGLCNDPNYSIVNECLPYISRRLLTDHANMGPALNTFIFGPEKSNRDRIVDYRRVEQLVEGFGKYSTSASGALLGKESLSRTELLEGAADQILDLVFSEEETPLQGILIEQMAKIWASGGRSLWTELRERSGVLPSGRTRLGALVDPLGLWRTSPLVRPNELDNKTIETTRRLFTLFRQQIRKSDNPLFDLSTLTREEALALSSILSRKLWARRRGVLQTSNRFARSLLELTANKLEMGERDTRAISPRKEPPVDNKSFVSEQMEAIPVRQTSGKVLNARSLLTQVQKRESDRLAGARRLLEELKDEDGEGNITPKVIKTTL